MSAGGTGRPYLEAWLRRTRKQLSGSGRLTELSMILGADGSITQNEWRSRLQAILDGKDEPSLELLTRIDSLLAKATGGTKIPDTSDDLFGQTRV